MYRYLSRRFSLVKSCTQYRNRCRPSKLMLPPAATSDQCLGFRASEIVGLQWGDFDWKTLEVYIQRGVVSGRVDEVKTTSSNRRLPVHANLAVLLVEYKAETGKKAAIRVPRDVKSFQFRLSASS